MADIMKPSIEYASGSAKTISRPYIQDPSARYKGNPQKAPGAQKLAKSGQENTILGLLTKAKPSALVMKMGGKRKFSGGID